MKRDDQALLLDDLLGRWHRWCQQATVGRGHASRSLVVGEYRTSRQYDDANGALDDDLERSTMKAVNFNVGEMRDPWRSAIHAQARAIHCGVLVWSSPRLPQDREARELVVQEARAMLIGRLTAAGVM